MVYAVKKYRSTVVSRKARPSRKVKTFGSLAALLTSKAVLGAISPIPIFWVPSIVSATVSFVANCKGSVFPHIPTIPALAVEPVIKE